MKTQKSCANCQHHDGECCNQPDWLVLFYDYLNKIKVEKPTKTSPSFVCPEHTK